VLSYCGRHITDCLIGRNSRRLFLHIPRLVHVETVHRRTACHCIIINSRTFNSFSSTMSATAEKSLFDPELGKTRDDSNSEREPEETEEAPVEPPSGPPSGPPIFPEGGLRAWTAVFGCWCALFFTFGYVNTFGYVLFTVVSRSSF
jgi:hypothetical protein